MTAAKPLPITAESDLPEGWALAKVGEICTYPQYGWTTSAQKDKGELRLLRTSDISNGEVNWALVPGCAHEPDDPEKYLLDSGDILISRAGSVGLSYLVKDCPRAVFASYLIRFRPIPPIEPAFVALFLKSPSYWSAIAEEAAGIAIPNVNASKLKEIDVLLPPLAEQKRIVDKAEQLLARVNAARERLTRVPAILKRFRQAVLAAACSGRLTADWRVEQVECETPGALITRITARRKQRYEEQCSKAKKEGLKPLRRSDNLEPRTLETATLPEIPDEWTWAYLSDLGYMNRGKSRHRPRNAPHLYGGPYPFIQTGDIAQADGRIRTHRQCYSEVGLAQSRLWPAATVCITIAANIAHSAILTYPACFPDSVVGVIPDSDLCISEYLQYFVETARADLEQFAPATAQKNINIEILSDVAVPLPPLTEQQEIVRRVEALFNLVDAIEKRVAAATVRGEKLTQAVLAKAFRGELVPTEAELARREGRPYEPASALLARIQTTRQTLPEKPKQRSPKRRTLS